MKLSGFSIAIARKCYGLADDVFTIHHSWLFEYAAELSKRHLTTPFECITKGPTGSMKRVADTLAELKCFSRMDWLREWVAKKYSTKCSAAVTVEQVRKAVAMCKSRGMQTGMVPHVGL